MDSSEAHPVLHERRLQIQKTLPEAVTLVRELQDFRVRFTDLGHMQFSAREGKHDDLVLALAIAVWRLTRMTSGANWCEYMRREVEAAQADALSDPKFGYQVTARAGNANIVRLRVPEGVSHVYAIDGTPYTVPNDRILSLPREHAIPLQAHGWEIVNA